jgi:hypothetical protein
MGCIKKAVEWCEDLPSRDATYVKKMDIAKKNLQNITESN